MMGTYQTHCYTEIMSAVYGKAYGKSVVHVVKTTMMTWLMFSGVSKLMTFCRGPLNAIKAVAIETVMPLFRAAVERAEELLLRLHSCDFSAATEAAVTHASAPVTELAQHLLHCR